MLLLSLSSNCLQGLSNRQWRHHQKEILILANSFLIDFQTRSSKIIIHLVTKRFSNLICFQTLGLLFRKKTKGIQAVFQFLISGMGCKVSNRSMSHAQIQSQQSSMKAKSLILTNLDLKSKWVNYLHNPESNLYPTSRQECKEASNAWLLSWSQRQMLVLGLAISLMKV